MSTKAQKSVVTAVGWNLDDHINHAVEMKKTAEQIAKLPSITAMKRAEEVFHSDDVLFVPTESAAKNARTWVIKLGDTTGRKVRWGYTLLMSEGDEYANVSFQVRVSRLRRLVQPRHRSWKSGIPFVGFVFTVCGNLFKKEHGIFWPSFEYDEAELHKYTRSLPRPVVH